MEPYRSEFYNQHHLDMLIDPQQFDERKLTCDSRYRQIIGQLDVMITQVKRQPGCNLTGELDRLLNTMRDHITAENGYMDMVNFPQAMKHRLHHQFICAITSELRHRSSQSREVLSDELEYIRQLWREHISVHDKVFEDYLSS